MKLFNFLRKNSTPTAEASSSPERQTPDRFTGQKLGIAAEQAITNRERQENKIIASLLRGEDALFQKQVDISPAERQQFYDQILNHQITREQESHLLQQISTPAHDRTGQLTRTGDVLAQLNTKHDQRILSYMTAVNGQMPASLTPDHITAFLQKYPTPIEFASAEQDFLTMIDYRNGDAKLREYEADIETFKHKIYGKRQEYYQALQSLEGKAHQYSRERYAAQQANILAHPKQARVTFIPPDQK